MAHSLKIYTLKGEFYNYSFCAKGIKIFILRRSGASRRRK
jgi:hypothetical protein